jgi:hypothetical protein
LNTTNQNSHRVDQEHKEIDARDILLVCALGRPRCSREGEGDDIMLKSLAPVPLNRCSVGLPPGLHLKKLPSLRFHNKKREMRFTHAHPKKGKGKLIGLQERTDFYRR